MRKLLIFLLLLFLLAIPTIAQEATEETPAELIQLAAFTLSNINMSGIYPADWDEIQVGAYIRNGGDSNTTYILHLAQTHSSLEALIAPILSALQLEELPEASATYDTSVFAWTLYKVAYSPAELEGETLFVDIATAEIDDAVYLILLQSNPDEYEILHEQVFLVALDAFGLPLETIIAEYHIPTLENITLSKFGIETAIPIDWQEVASGSYMRAENQQDITTLLIQTSPDLQAEAFAELLLERLGLPVQLPETDTIYETDNWLWSLYLIEVNAQGGLPVTFQIAIAQDEQFAYLVVLLSFNEEAEGLRETVIFPVLDATQALSSD
jgi:hypothetical protein